MAHLSLSAKNLLRNASAQWGLCCDSPLNISLLIHHSTHMVRMDSNAGTQDICPVCRLLSRCYVVCVAAARALERPVQPVADAW